MEDCCKDEKEKNGCCEACPDKGCDGCACSAPKAKEEEKAQGGCENCACGNR